MLLVENKCSPGSHYSNRYQASRATISNQGSTSGVLFLLQGGVPKNFSRASLRIFPNCSSRILNAIQRQAARDSAPGILSATEKMLSEKEHVPMALVPVVFVSSDLSVPGLGSL